MGQIKKIKTLLRYCSVVIFWNVIFCILGFSKCNTYNIDENIMYKDYVEIFTYSCIKVINWKENKEVGTICIQVRIPMKKPKIFLEFFSEVSKKIIIPNWIQKFYFGRKQKHIWERFYFIKRPVSNRAIILLNSDYTSFNIHNKCLFYLTHFIG